MGLHPLLFGINYFGKQKTRLVKDRDSITALTLMSLGKVEMNLKKREKRFLFIRDQKKIEFAKLRNINKLN